MKIRDKISKILIWMLQKVSKGQVIQEDLDRWGVNIKLETTELSNIISPAKNKEVSKFLNTFD